MAETESDIVRIAREYRQQLERNETAAMKEMSRAWVRMERAMRGEFEALAVIISEKAEAGEPVPAQFVYSLKRYQEMLIQLRAEIAKYNTTAEDIIKDTQRENIELGIDGAGEQLTVSAPVGIEWVKIYPEAAENMVGYAADGSPLKTLLERDYQSGAQAVTDALIDGVGLGKGWKAVASDMEKAVGMSFDRSVTIARTEMARAYRQANMRQYQASGVVEKVFRLAYKPTACFACLILDGTEIKGEFEDHPRGKCTSIVQTIGGHRPTWQTGSEWFMEQSADDQRRLMGAGRWELWKDGVIKSLSDFVYIRPNQAWGGSPAVKTFDMLGVQSPLKQPKPSAGVQTVEASSVADEIARIQEEARSDKYIPDWFMKKLEKNDNGTTVWYYDTNHGKVIRETEKAYQLELDYYSPYGGAGTRKVWVPKSVAQTYEQAQQTAAAKTEKMNNAFAEMDRLIQLGKDNGVKGIRRGMKRVTIEKMLRDAGVDY